MSKKIKWTTEMNETLLALAAKHPHGNAGRVAWRNVLADPTWKWKISEANVRHHFYNLNQSSNGQQSKVGHWIPPIDWIPPAPPIKTINYCPYCGENLTPHNMAVAVEQMTNGVRNGK